MYLRWQEPSRTAKGAARIINLIRTDLIVSVVDLLSALKARWCGEDDNPTNGEENQKPSSFRGSRLHFGSSISD